MEEVIVRPQPPCGEASNATVKLQKPKIRIVHVFAPEIIKTDRANFRDLVQRLTGKPEGDGKIGKNKNKKKKKKKKSRAVWKGKEVKITRGPGEMITMRRQQEVGREVGFGGGIKVEKSIRERNGQAWAGGFLGDLDRVVHGVVERDDPLVSMSSSSTAVHVDLNMSGEIGNTIPVAHLRL